MQKIKRMLTVLAVFALASPAPAEPPTPVPVLNGSFEEATGGWEDNYDCVALADVQYGGHLDNTLASNPSPPNPLSTRNPSEPTGQGGRPRYWTYTGSVIQDDVVHDSRWGGVWNTWTAGPTDGHTAIFLDNLSYRAAADQATWIEMRQTLSLNVGELKALGSLLVMSFDLRYNQADSTAAGVDADGDDFVSVYFEVDGVQDAAATWTTLLDATRKIHTFSEINALTPAQKYGAATKDTPGVPKEGTVGSDNMETFTVTLDLSSHYNNNAAVSLVVHNTRFKDGDTPSASSRVYMDNLRVDAVRPPTGALLLVK